MCKKKKFKDSIDYSWQVFKEGIIWQQMGL